MAIENSPDVKNGKHIKRFDDAETAVLPLEEFKSSLIQRGFEMSSRSRKIYYNPDIPNFRFVMGKSVVRLEKKNPGRVGREWQLDTSYRISRQLHFAINAVDQLHFEPERINRRKSVGSKGAIIFFLILGSVLFCGGFLAILFSKERYNCVAFVIPGILILSLGMNRIIRNRKLVNSPIFTVADVIDRQVAADSVAAEYDTWGEPSYFLIIRFIPITSKGSGQYLCVSVAVDKHKYKSYPRGSTIEVRYASEDPRIVILEGE